RPLASLAASGAHGRCAAARYHPAPGAPLHAVLDSTLSHPTGGCLISPENLPTPMGSAPQPRANSPCACIPPPRARGPMLVSAGPLTRGEGTEAQGLLARG